MVLSGGESASPRIKSGTNNPGKHQNQMSNKWDNIHESGRQRSMDKRLDRRFPGMKWDERRAQAWFRSGRRFFGDKSARSTGELFHVEHSLFSPHSLIGQANAAAVIDSWRGPMSTGFRGRDVRATQKKCSTWNNGAR